MGGGVGGGMGGGAQQGGPGMQGGMQGGSFGSRSPLPRFALPPLPPNAPPPRMDTRAARFEPPPHPCPYPPSPSRRGAAFVGPTSLPRLSLWPLHPGRLMPLQPRGAVIQADGGASWAAWAHSSVAQRTGLAHVGGRTDWLTSAL